MDSPILHCDYNSLPPENQKFVIREILAKGAGINSDGFVHLKGCEKINKIVLDNCSYITDEALEKLVSRKDSLKELEISQCDISDEGLKSLKVLSNLEKLTVREIPDLKDPEGVTKQLKEHLKNCVIDIK